MLKSLLLFLCVSLAFSSIRKFEYAKDESHMNGTHQRQINLALPVYLSEEGAKSADLSVSVGRLVMSDSDFSFHAGSDFTYVEISLNNSLAFESDQNFYIHLARSTTTTQAHFGIDSEFNSSYWSDELEKEVERTAFKDVIVNASAALEQKYSQIEGDLTVKSYDAILEFSGSQDGQHYDKYSIEVTLENSKGSTFEAHIIDNIEGGNDQLSVDMIQENKFLN